MVAAAAVIGAGLLWTQPQFLPVVEGATPSRSAVLQAIAFRVSYGFEADPDVVTARESDSTLDRMYGVALTDEETKELERRERITAQLEPLTLALDALPSFAGLYIDQKSGGVIDIAIAQQEELGQGILALVPPGAEFRVRHVLYTQRELQMLQEVVSGDIPDLTARGVAITSVGVDPSANRLRVGVVGSTAIVAQDLIRRYGPAITVVEGEPYTFGACVSRNNCPAPLKGGLTITDANQGICTSGLVGRPIDPPAVPVLRMLTAGHCIDQATGGSGLNVNWSHNGVVMGKSNFERLYNGTSADVGGIIMSEAGARNKVYASDNLDMRSVTGKWTAAQQPIGATVCRGGRQSGWFCAQISARDQTVVVKGRAETHMDVGAPI
jgi:hypothetical protein